jgi:hypothetical protein
VEKLASKADLQHTETWLNASIAELRSDMKVMRWQLGTVFVCVVVPLLRLAFDLIAQTRL